jgi:hypothetical protein
MDNSGAELIGLSEAGNRSATWCNTRFPNEVQGKQGKTDCSVYD